MGSSVIHKEKQVRKKEHKLKITPMNADVIVLGLQSRDQAEQWLRVRVALGWGGTRACSPAGSPGAPQFCLPDFFYKGWPLSRVKDLQSFKLPGLPCSRW